MSLTRDEARSPVQASQVIVKIGKFIRGIVPMATIKNLETDEEIMDHKIDLLADQVMQIALE